MTGQSIFGQSSTSPAKSVIPVGKLPFSFGGKLTDYPDFRFRLRGFLGGYGLRDVLDEASDLNVKSEDSAVPIQFLSAHSDPVGMDTSMLIP